MDGYDFSNNNTAAATTTEIAKSRQRKMKINYIRRGNVKTEFSNSK